MATHSPPARSEAATLLAEEIARDQVRAATQANETARSRGVAWSGLGPDRWVPRSRARLEADAAGRLTELRAWRKSATGRFLTAVARAQRAAAAAHLAGETARDALARDFDAELDRCLAAARRLEAEGRALVAAAHAARRALGR